MSKIYHGGRVIDDTLPESALTAALRTKINGYITAAQLQTTINNLVTDAPGLLNTLGELSDAIADDPNFAATMATQLAAKANVAGEVTFNDLLKVGNELRRLNTAIQNSGVPGAGSYFSGFLSADMAKLTDPANWDVSDDGKYVGPALVTNYATFVLVPSPSAGTPGYRFETNGTASGAVRFIGL